MTVADRALNPYPPANFLFDGSAFPSSFANTSPIGVTWARRERTKGIISLQTDADETPDNLTNYYLRHGPPNSFRTEVDLGTGTSSTFNFDFAGLNKVEIYSKSLGRTSSIITFYTNVLTGTGVVAGGNIGTLTTAAPHVQARITAGGTIPALAITVGLIPHVSGDIGTLTLTPPSGGLEIQGSGDVGTLALVTPTGVVALAANLSGDVGSVTITPPTGEEEVAVDAAGSIGTLTSTAPDGTTSIPASLSGSIGTLTDDTPSGEARPSAAESGGIGTLTANAVTGVASGGGGGGDQVPIPGSGAIEITTSDGEYQVPESGGVSS